MKMARPLAVLLVSSVAATTVVAGGCGGGSTPVPAPATNTAARSATAANAMSHVVPGAEATRFVDASGSTPAYLFFDATWCHHQCSALRGQVAEHIGRFPDANANTRRVDLDEAAALGERFGVTSVPTLLRIEAGRVVKRRMGAYKMTGSGGYEAGGVYNFYMY